MAQTPTSPHYTPSYRHIASSVLHQTSSWDGYGVESRDGESDLEDTYNAGEIGCGDDFWMLQLEVHASARLPFAPKPWQLQVAFNLLQGKSVLLLAGTGRGKSLTFILPGLVTNKPTLILSPLIALQEDQVAGFKQINVTAVAVNGTNYSTQLLKEIEAGKYEVVLTSPEFVLESQKWRPLVASQKFTHFWGLVVVDEAHCALRWGQGKGTNAAFRKAWGNIRDLHALLKRGTPLLAATATLAVQDWPALRNSLGLPSDTVVINLGNDRPEIFFECRRIKHSLKSMKDLSELIVSEDGKLIKTMIFFDDRKLAHDAQRRITENLPALMDEVAVYHSLRTLPAKRDAMERFAAGEYKVLLCTEAAGMGCNIWGVAQVIQWRIPKSLDVWLQRAGRAARGPGESGRAILLASDNCMINVYNGLAQLDSSLQAMAIEALNQSKSKGKTHREQGKNAREESIYDMPMNEWAASPDCRRIVPNKIYGNPTRESAPPDICCDRCRDNHICITSPPMADPPIVPHLPRSPTPSDPGSSSSDESCAAPDVNGKRKPAVHRGHEHCEQAKSAIRAWRDKMWQRDFRDCLVGPEIVIDDVTLRKVARQLRMSDRAVLSEEWDAYELYGTELLDVLMKVDRDEHERKETAKRARVAKYAITKLQNQAAANRCALGDLTNTPVASPYARSFIPGTGVFQYEVQSASTTYSPLDVMTSAVISSLPSTPMPAALGTASPSFPSLRWNHMTPEMMEKCTVPKSRRKK